MIKSNVDAVLFLLVGWTNNTCLLVQKQGISVCSIVYYNYGQHCV